MFTPIYQTSSGAPIQHRSQEFLDRHPGTSGIANALIGYFDVSIWETMIDIMSIFSQSLCLLSIEIWTWFFPSIARCSWDRLRPVINILWKYSLLLRTCLEEMICITKATYSSAAHCPLNFSRLDSRFACTICFQSKQLLFFLYLVGILKSREDRPGLFLKPNAEFDWKESVISNN